MGFKIRFIITADSNNIKLHMGRACNGLSVSLAEFVMGRYVTESIQLCFLPTELDLFMEMQVKNRVGRKCPMTSYLRGKWLPSLDTAILWQLRLDN